MSKKKKKSQSVQTEVPQSKAELSQIFDEAKKNLFQFDNSMDFIESSDQTQTQAQAQAQAQTQESNLDAELTSVDVAATEIITEETAIPSMEAQADDATTATAEAKTKTAKLGSGTIEDAESAESSAETDSNILVSDANLMNEEVEPFLTQESNENLFEHSSDNVENFLGADEASELSEFAESSDSFNDFEQAEFEGAEATEPVVQLAGTELDKFDSVEIEELEFISEEQMQSVMESIFFASDRPVSLASIKQVFLGTNVTNARIKAMIEKLRSHYAAQTCGVTLEDVGSGFQLRTKLDNMEFLRRSLKAKPFKLSGPALEVLAIVAYKQPTIKNEIDQIRGVESGHLLRALMEKNLVIFAGKSDLPGKPMQYVTSRKFLEIFSLRNLKELPTLSQIDELIPEGIGDEEIQKPKLHDITDGLSQQAGTTYSEGEEELNKITDQLQTIQTSTDFFEQEKIRQREKKDEDRAQNIRDALAVGETVSTRDLNWLKRYEEKPEETQAVEGAVIQAQGEGAFTDMLDEADDIAEAMVAEKESGASTKVKDDFDELNNVFSKDSSDDEDVASWADPEILEANDLADIDGDGDSPVDTDIIS